MPSTASSPRRVCLPPQGRCCARWIRTTDLRGYEPGELPLLYRALVETAAEGDAGTARLRVSTPTQSAFPNSPYLVKLAEPSQALCQRKHLRFCRDRVVCRGISRPRILCFVREQKRQERRHKADATASSIGRSDVPSVPPPLTLANSAPKRAVLGGYLRASTNASDAKISGACSSSFDSHTRRFRRPG